MPKTYKLWLDVEELVNGEPTGKKGVDFGILPDCLGESPTIKGVVQIGWPIVQAHCTDPENSNFRPKVKASKAGKKQVKKLGIPNDHPLMVFLGGCDRNSFGQPEFDAMNLLLAAPCLSALLKEVESRLATSLSKNDKDLRQRIIAQVANAEGQHRPLALR